MLRYSIRATGHTGGPISVQRRMQADEPPSVSHTVHVNHMDASFRTLLVRPVQDERPWGHRVPKWSLL